MGGKEEASLRQTTMISLPDTPPPLGVPLQYLFLFLPLFQSSPLSVSPLPPSITGLSFCRPHHSPSFFPLSSPAVTSSIPVVSISLRPPLAAHSLAEEGWDDSVCLTPPPPSLPRARRWEEGVINGGRREICGRVPYCFAHCTVGARC